MPRRTLRSVAATAALLLGATGPAPATAVATTAEPDPPLERVLRQARAEHRTPGMQAARIDDATVTTAVADGTKVGSGDPVRPGHYFHLASLTKAVTSTAIAGLVEHGLVPWSSTPGEIFPRLAASLDPRLRHVTLAQSLSHRGGIRPYLYPEADAALPDWTSTPTERRRAFALWLLRRPPEFRPGSFHYSTPATRSRWRWRPG